MKKVILFAAVLFLSACTSTVTPVATEVADSLGCDSIVIDSIVISEGAIKAVAADTTK